MQKRNFFSKYLQHYSGLSKSCWEAILLDLIASLAGGAMGFFSLFFVQALHFQVKTAGWLLSAAALGTIAGGLLGGKLCDYYSPRRIMLFGMMLHGISCFIAVTFHAFSVILFSMVIMGIAAYTSITANRLWIIEACGSNSMLRLRGINISHAASNAGQGLSGALFGLMAGLNIRLVFWFISASLLIPALFLLLKQTSWSTYTVPPNKPDFADMTVYQPDRRIFFLVLGFLCIAGFFVAQGTTVYPLFITALFPAMGTRAVSTLFVLNTLMVTLFQAPLVSMLNNKNRLAISAAGIFLMGAGYLMLAFTLSFVAAIAACLVNVTGEMLFFAVSQLLCHEKAPKNKRNQAIGIYQAVYAFSRTASPVAGACLYQHYGANMLWYLCGTIGLACLFPCFSWLKRSPVITSQETA